MYATIEVNKQHLSKTAFYGSPIEAALKDAGYPNSYADLYGVFLGDTKTPTTIRVRRELNKLDAGKPVAPFRFRVNVPGSAPVDTVTPNKAPLPKSRCW